MTASPRSSGPTMTDCRCLWCHRSLRRQGSFLNLFFVDDVLCDDCRQKMEAGKRRIDLGSFRVECLYIYEGLVRNMIIQYKEMYDEALFPVFLWPYVRDLRRKYRHHVLVPVPSIPENNRKRGFRAVDRLFSLLELPLADVLVKKGGPDQKELAFKQRSRVGKHIELKRPVKGEKILLVDDIVTTGETLKACYRLLNPGNEVRVFGVAANRRFFEK